MKEKTASLGREAGSAVRWNAAAAGATLLSQFLQLVVLARILKPSEFGLAATAISIAGFIQSLGDFGFTNALVQRTHIGEKAWSSALWTCVLGGLLLFAGLYMLSPVFETLLNLKGLTPLLCIAAFTLPWAGPGFVFQADLQRRLKFSRLAKAEIAAAVASLAVGLGWVLWRREAMALVAGQVTLLAIRCIILFFASSLRPAFHIRPSDLRPLASFGGYQLGERVLNYASANFDRLLVARLLGASAAGYYTVASQIALRPMALLGPFVFRTLFPLFARLQQEKERLASSLLRSVSLLSFVSAGLYALLFALAAPLSRLVLGSGWEASIPILRILTGLGFVLAISNPLASLALALGRARIGFWINLLVLTSSMIFVVIGSHYGLRGVAWGMVFSVALLMPLDFILARRWVGVKPVELLLSACWALPSALLAVLAMQVFGNWHTGFQRWMEIGTEGILGLIVFTASAWLLQRSRLKESLQELTVKFKSDPD